MLSLVSDEGPAIHYSAVPRGTPVYSSDGVEIGKVDQVVDNYREHILDGVVIDTGAGELRFVDAPEVARTAERRVTLAITQAEAAKLPGPEKSAGAYRANVPSGRLGRLFGGGWKKE